MSLNSTQLGKNILAAFKTVFAKKWPEIKEYGQAEAKKLAQTLVMIEALKAAGKINEEQARLHLEIQKNATRTVMLTLEGLGILAVEAALNAGLATIKDAVNTAVGFTLV
ncbi:hypothetical protein EZJ19_12355 [Parasulfuritortus cantonensis]|uniref:Uncharacterized protein n=1 Tax=Parasulfuritortus cantonensis TaxID=2528202 RepID=A0A4R1B7N3_9PROT|nr:hypothetical protein [Parasulfuritortus cantonensis]TCJ12325.1 hypothetical protein EZJ19_12355 [Parasulfuritortus cantonensis]